MEAEQTQVNLLVVQAFDALRIAYFLGGSMASSIHGLYRATADADFVAALRPDHAEPFAKLLKPAFYAESEIIRAASEAGRSFNIINFETMLKVDVFVARPEPFHIAQMRRRVLQEIGGNTAKIYVSSPEDTILAKIQWYREGGCVSDRQWNDILGVFKVQADGLDRAYLAEWARELRVTDLLAKAYQDAGSQ
jgi:hypothetical protein